MLLRLQINKQELEDVVIRSSKRRCADAWKTKSTLLTTSRTFRSYLAPSFPHYVMFPRLNATNSSIWQGFHPNDHTHALRLPPLSQQAFPPSNHELTSTSCSCSAAYTLSYTIGNLQPEPKSKLKPCGKRRYLKKTRNCKTSYRNSCQW